MSRQQQKAVFANLGQGSSVSNMSARRESLMSNDLANETKQDKIDRVMRDSRLTHRQKMDRIARIKSGTTSGSSAGSVTGFSQTKVDSPAIKLIYQQVLDKAETRRLQRKAYKEKHPTAVFEPTKKPGVYLLKEHGKTYTWIDGKKVKKKDMSYKELKAAGVPLKPNKDYDKDGVKNSKDCRPMNKKKQDLWSEVGALGYSAAKAGAKAGTSFAKKQAYAHSAEGRAARAQAKIDKINAKERKHIKMQNAKRLEEEAKDREAEYKKAHPKKFGLF